MHTSQPLHNESPAMRNDAGTYTPRSQQAIEQLHAPHQSCAFCAIVAGELPASIVWEDERTVAFLDLRQYHIGHVLVVPKRHVNDLRDADDLTAAAVMKTTSRMARAVSHAFGGEGLSIWHSAGEAANQEVPHLHFHVHPRVVGDGVLRVYPESPTKPGRAMLEAWAAQIRESVAVV